MDGVVRRGAGGVVDDDDDEEEVGPHPPPPPGLLMGDGGVGAPGGAAEANGPDPGVQPEPEGHAGDGRGFDGDAHATCFGFGEAVGYLEDEELRNYWIGFDVEDRRESTQGEDEVDNEIDIGHDEARVFRRFVDLLGRRDGSRTFYHIGIHVDWSELRDQDMERLFKDVLPAHPYIEDILIDVTRLPRKFWRILTESFPTTEEDSILRWKITANKIDPAAYLANVHALVDTLFRNDAIGSLWVDSNVDDDHSNLICRALSCNTKLRSLTLMVKQVSADTLDGVATSSLHDLCVWGEFSEGTIPSLAKQLRNNETLESLELSGEGMSIRDSQALLDLVKYYNCSLRLLHVFHGSQLNGDPLLQLLNTYLTRNEWIRNALVQLQPVKASPDERQQEVPRSGALSPKLVERLLIEVSDVPTALYRIMKMGYVHMVGKRLALPATIRRLVLRELCDYKPNASIQSKEDRAADALMKLANLLLAEARNGSFARATADECDAAIRVLTLLQWNAHHARLLEQGFFFLATWLYQNPSGADKVRRQGLDELVIDAMKRFPELEALQRRALEALDNLYVCAADADKAHFARKLHGIEVTVSTMTRYPENYHVQARCIRLLAWMCQVPDLQSDVIRAKALGHVVTAAEAHMGYDDEGASPGLTAESDAAPSPPLKYEMHRWAEELTTQLMPLVCPENKRRRT